MTYTKANINDDHLITEIFDGKIIAYDSTNDEIKFTLDNIESTSHRNFVLTQHTEFYGGVQEHLYNRVVGIEVHIISKYFVDEQIDPVLGMYPVHAIFMKN